MTDTEFADDLASWLNNTVEEAQQFLCNVEDAANNKFIKVTCNEGLPLSHDGTSCRVGHVILIECSRTLNAIDVTSKAPMSKNANIEVMVNIGQNIGFRA